MDEDGGYPSSQLKIKVDRNPNAMLLKDPYVSTLSVTVCGECGFSQLFASGPQYLWQAYQDAKRG